jgi:hypothetical protein
MAWTKTADFEENDLSDFNSTVGSNLSATTASKHGGTYGMSVALATTAQRYGLFTPLTNVQRVETEFWCDPNSAVLNGLTPICGVSNNYGYQLATVNLCKPTGSANYIACLLGRNLYRARTEALDQMQYHTTSYQYPTITDAYHKFRLIVKVRAASDWGSYYSNMPGGMSTVPDSAFSSNIYDALLFIDDVFSCYVGGRYSKEQGNINYIGYGVYGWAIAANSSGTLFMDDISWAQNEGSVAVPTLLRTSVNSNSVWTTPAYSSMIEGETGAFSLIWNGAGAVSAGTVYGYLNLVDKSSLLFPSGSTSASGNIQTSKAITGLIGGNTYVLVFSTTVDGKTVMRKHRIKCVKPGEDL